MESVALQDPRFSTVLELAVRFGKTLIVYDVDHIEPMMYGLLRKDLEKQGPRQVVCIGDKYIDYHEEFRMYLVTRSPHPKLPPDARPLVSVTNFTITRNGLEGRVTSEIGVCVLVITLLFNVNPITIWTSTTMCLTLYTADIFGHHCVSKLCL